VSVVLDGSFFSFFSLYANYSMRDILFSSLKVAIGDKTSLGMHASFHEGRGMQGDRKKKKMQEGLRPIVQNIPVLSIQKV
jgi:hypothetical protein